MEIKVKRSYKYANVPKAKSANVNQTFFENTNVQICDLQIIFVLKPDNLLQNRTKSKTGIVNKQLYINI